MSLYDFVIGLQHFKIDRLYTSLTMSPTAQIRKLEPQKALDVNF